MITPEMKELLNVLIDYFGTGGEIAFAERLIEIRDRSNPLRGGGSAASGFAPTPITEFKKNDAVRLKLEHWGHSRGIRGSKGKIRKINRKTYIVDFEGRFRGTRVPKDMLEAWAN